VALRVVGAVFGLVAISAGPAFGYWVTTDSSNPALAIATTLSAPTAPTAIASSSYAVAVGWSLPTNQVSGAEDQVTRTSPGTPTTVCTVAPNVTSCQDTNLIPGTTYAYSIEAVFSASSWQSSAITTSASTPKVTPTITTTANPASVTVGGSVDDQATISNGFGPTGTITWNLYASTDTTCTGTTYFTSSKQAVNGTSTYTSSDFATAAAGSYVWGFVYSGDASNNPVSVCGGTGESLTVSKATPNISTTATTSTSVGSSVSDTANLSNGVSPSGTITFTLYGPSSTQSCATQVAQVTKSVTGNGSYLSPSITPTQAGTYWWIAAYGGDTNNQPVSDVCGASGESSAVSAVTPTIATTATPSSVTIGGSVADQAVLSNGYSPSGTITWKLYASSDTNCTGAVYFTTTAQAVNGNSTYTSASFTTTAIGTYKWDFSYAGDVNNNPVSACGGTGESLTVNKASPALTAVGHPSGTAGMALSASSISSVLSSSYQGTGTMTFTVFGPSTSAPTSCTSGGTAVGTAAASGNGTYYPSTGYSPTQAGNYWWYASYAGDTNNNPASSTCGSGMSETVVAPVPVTITGVSGDNGNDKVAFTGTGTPGGSITVSICKVNAFPCSTGNLAGTAAVSPVGSNDFWTTPSDDNNLTPGGQYFAQAAQTSPAATSAVLTFNAEKSTNTSATITTPASGTCYYTSTSSDCTTSPRTAWSGNIAGTASDGGGPALKTVQVAISNTSGMWWNGSSFASSVPVYNAATGTSSWTYPLSAVQLGTTTGTFTVQATATDNNTETGPVTSTTFTWKD
jgi:hypothetical protein